MRLLILSALLTVTAFSQAFRADPFTFTTAGQAPPNASVPVLTLPGAQVQICTDAACSVLATTYTSSSAGSQCPSNAQATLPGTVLCRSTSGAQGQWGFWASSGTYYYTFRFNGVRHGPYPVSVGGGGGGGPGTVTSFSVTSVPSWLTASVATATTTPALTLSATTGQTSGRVIGTCGAATSFAPCALVAGDLPLIQITGGGSGQTTKQAAYDALAPTATRAGDITYWNGTHYVNLPGNNSGTRVLQEDSSGVPTWVTAGSGGTVTSVTIQGTTNQISVAGGCVVTTSGVCTVSIPNDPILINSATVNANATTLPTGITGTLLHLGQTDGAVGVALTETWGAGSSFIGRRADGTNASRTALQANDVIVTLGAYGYGATAYSSTSRLDINLKASQIWTDTAQGTYLQILTTPNGSLSPAVALTLNQDKTLQLPGYSTGVTKTDSSGNVGLVSGTGSNCVHVDATSAACGGISGLTTNRIPKAASSTSIADSSLLDDGTTVSTSEAFAAGSTSTGVSPPPASVCGPNGTTPSGLMCLAEGNTPIGTLLGVGVLWADASHFTHINNNNVDSYMVQTNSLPSAGLAQFAGSTSKVTSLSLGTGVATALGTNVSGSGAICLATGSACGSTTFYAYSVSTQSPVTETGSLTDLAVSSTLPALAAGHCYRFEAAFTFTTAASNSSLQLWYGTSNAGSTVIYGSGGNVTGSTTHPITITGSVCNGAGVQNAQVLTLNTLWQNGTGGFADNAAGTENATLTTLKIGFSGTASGSNNVTVVQYFNIWAL